MDEGSCRQRQAKRKDKKGLSVGHREQTKPVGIAASLESENRIFAISGMYSKQAIGNREKPQRA
jgi:hypothetical protein